MNNYKVSLQLATEAPNIPTRFELQRWISATLEGRKTKAEVCLRMVNEQEIQQLNKTYRGFDKPTNVLSFPYTLPDSIELEYPLLGDLVICPNIVALEATEQHKPLKAHWAHMVIHGVLHLLGYDHIEEKDALIMEPIEIDILKRLGFSNPYETHYDESYRK